MTATPTLKAPPGSCDCHMHVYDDRYPLASTWKVPPPKAPAVDYREVQRELGLERTVVVQPNAYGFDNSCTIDAIWDLGPEARGVATVAPDVTDEELQRLHAAGIRGARLYMLPSTFFTWDDVPTIAARVAPLGWHVQVQLDGRELAAIRRAAARIAHRSRHRPQRQVHGAGGAGASRIPRRCCACSIRAAAG